MTGDEDQRLKAPEAAAARGDGREEEKEMGDQPARLPDDVLAAILRRVPPRWLAASRCVCRAWRDAVDGRRLLRADLLPLSLAGLFVHFDEHKFPEFFARPSSSTAAGARAVSGDLSFLPSASPHCGHIYDDDCVDGGDYAIEDHCNGLLLLSGNYVVNPATRRWHTLPVCPPKRVSGAVRYRAHLVYDPMVSPYYDVVMIPTLDAYHRGDEVDPSFEESEWPPSRCKMYVFSSKTGCWEEKYLVRKGDALGIVSDMRAGYRRFSTVNFRGALYVLYGYDLIMRISLSDNTYGVTKPPMDTREKDYYPFVQIVRSKNGVYFVELNTYWPQHKCWLGVWILNESSGQMEWILKHDKDLKHMLARLRFSESDQWILEDINYNLFLSSSCPEDNKKATTEEYIEWNSDIDVENEEMVDHCYLEDNKREVVVRKLEQNPNDHSALSIGDSDEECNLDEEHCDYSYADDIGMLGFHPYKEIVFLSASRNTALAYHLNGLKIEELGNIYPKEYTCFKELSNELEKIKSFPYTPCWIEEFP